MLRFGWRVKHKGIEKKQNRGKSQGPENMGRRLLKKDDEVTNVVEDKDKGRIGSHGCERGQSWFVRKGLL